jgi:hypothetical protein
MGDTDFIGKCFGRLTVVGVYDKKNNMKRWACKCDCGNIIPVYKPIISNLSFFLPISFLSSSK